MNKQPTDLTLNNGTTMPAIGLGVMQGTQKESEEAVLSAIETGYRLIDTASAYMNEKSVGEGIRRSGINRSDLFVTTKLWVTDYGTEEAKRGFEASLRRLGTDYVDLYLLHQPMPTEFDKTVAAYKAAETFLKKGRAKAIGVCNFAPAHLERLINETSVVPAVNQIEVHPFFIQRELRAVNTKLGIKTQAWSPLAGIHVYMPNSKDTLNPHKHPTLVALGEKYEKTPAQIMLRWHVQIGNCAIPKSVNADRIKENFAVFDFALTPEDILSIENLDTGVRGGPDPEIITTTTFGFTIDNSPQADNANRE
ncbi:MAG: aldo/keto reductase [Acidobacteria bacterium]|nr:aldo/keto reductase [Acidobacteriota bacterium]MBI3424436.1 aldo/keto reductase [Acidobacteriota bacterium]